MEESVTYQAIVEEGVVKGRLKQARLMLVLLGEEEFGSLPARACRRPLKRSTAWISWSNWPGERGTWRSGTSC